MQHNFVNSVDNVMKLPHLRIIEWVTSV